jgi:DNA-binding winged helix-turn-helix (wHTH) protein
MASSRSFPAVRARFGRFQLDLNSRELFCSGTRVSIQDKPLQILRLLLDAEGQVVSREQIRAALWPEDTFVDFEHGLNTAVKKLRQALEDSAEAPEYIETLPRVGYRFLVSVEWEEGNAVRRASSVVTMPLPASQPGPHQPGPQLVVVVQSKRLPWLPVVIAVTVAVLASVFWYLCIPLPPPRITGYTQLTYDGQPKFPAGTDGTRLYFTQMSPRSVNEIGVNGGETAQVPLAVRGSKLFLSDVSPDGSTALVSSYDTEPWSLLSTPLLGGSITHVGDGEKGVFSSDGTSIIYAPKTGKSSSPGETEAILTSWRPCHLAPTDSVGPRPGEQSGLQRVMACGRWRPMVREFTACFPTGHRTLHAAAAGLLMGISTFSCSSIRSRTAHRSGLSMSEGSSSGRLAPTLFN